MIIDSGNIVNLEGEEITFEEDAKIEEQRNADAIYNEILTNIKSEEACIPFPQIKPFTTAGAAGCSLFDLQYMKSHNRPHWEKIWKSEAYYNDESLYKGHLKYSNGGERYFMESSLPTCTLDNITLVNTDDKNYQKDVNIWTDPNASMPIDFSRNIEIEKRKVVDVTIRIDKRNSAYSYITDNYLRNALKRNKDKQGIQSIIQTIQTKQNYIRSLDKDASFVVQGCAGSGKTMVLLHHLRYLIFNKDISSEDYIFLVPSNSFKRYLKDTSEKFLINFNSVHSHQGYYRYLLDKPFSFHDIEQSELVFAPEYLQHIYSKEFIKECYRDLLNDICEKANSLVERTEEALYDTIEKEKEKALTYADQIKEKSVFDIKEAAHDILLMLPFSLNSFEDIPNILKALSDLYQEYADLLKAKKLDTVHVEISPDDERILSDPAISKLVQETQKEQSKKILLFTAAAHKKKIQQLLDKQTVLKNNLIAKLTEEEKQRRAAEAAQHSTVFGGVTLQDVSRIISETRSVYNKAQHQLGKQHFSEEEFMLKMEKRYAKEIALLNQLIESSLDTQDHILSLADSLMFAVSNIEEFLQTYSPLLNIFSGYVSERRSKEYYSDAYRLFRQRTSRELSSLLYTRLFNICKKKIKKQFDIKLCKEYKHYWYLSLYCRYLTYGNTEKIVPYIYIDETQDLSLSELELIKKINSFTDKNGITQKPNFNLFGDVNQTITSHGITDWDSISLVDSIFTLDENFRNTNQIIDYCNSLLPFKMEKIGVDMEEVKEFEHISHAFKSIATKNVPTFIVKNDYMVVDLENELRKLGISEYSIYTVKRAKGLEFNKVFVVDQDMTDNEKYISYTRALSKLYVVHEIPITTDHNKTLIIQGEDEVTEEE